MPNRQEWIHIARAVVAALIGAAPFASEIVSHLPAPMAAAAGGSLIAGSALVVRLTQIAPINARLKAWLKY